MHANERNLNSGLVYHIVLDNFMYEVMNHHIFCVRECNDKNNFFLAEVGPKKILDLMNVPWLTRENVASHLQVYDLDM